MSEATIAAPSASSLRRIVTHDWFRRAVIALIVLNGILLGVETSRSLPADWMDLVLRMNRTILAFFVIEIVLRISAYRLKFFRDPWNLFDFAIIAAGVLVPAGPFQVLRTLRILRALRLVSAVPSLRRVVDGLLGAVPGIASVLFLLLLVIYIAAVMATMLFRDVAPNEFANLGLSLFSLFQIMTLEGWADIAIRVMQQQSWAWVYFIGYILVATFLVLNLVIGVVVSSIQARIEAESTAQLEESDDEIKAELTALRNEIMLLRESLDRKRTDER